MLNHVLLYRLDQRVVANSLHENSAIVVSRGSGYVYLKRKAAVALAQLVVYVLDALEPRERLVVNVMRFVVEHGQLFDVTHDHAEVNFAVGGLAYRLRPEEIVHQVVVVDGGQSFVACEHAVDVGEEDIARRVRDSNVVLHV